MASSAKTKSTFNNAASGDSGKKAPKTQAQKDQLIAAAGGDAQAAGLGGYIPDPSTNRDKGLGGFNGLVSGIGDFIGDAGDYFAAGGPAAQVLDKAGLGYAADMAAGGPVKRFGNAVATGIGNGDFKPAAQAFLNPGATPIANAVFGNVPGAVAAPSPRDLPSLGAGLQPGTNAGQPLPGATAAPAPSAPVAGGATGTMPYMPTGAGVLTTPGEGEKWFADHKGYYDQPTNLSGYWQGLQGRYDNAGGLQATATGDAWGKAKDWMAKPAAGANNASEVSTQLRDRTAGESTINQAKNYFTQPNQTLAYQNKVGNVFGQEGQAETYAKNNTAGLQSSGQGGQNAYKTMGGLSTPGAAENNNTTAQATLGANNSAKQFNQGLTQSGFANNNTTGNEMGYFSPDLRAKSRSEDLYDSGQGGKNLTTYYDRESQKRTKALSDQMSAMGVFGSGATARGLYELNADIGASQARDMAGMAAQADQAFLGRSSAAQSFAGQAGDEAIKRQGLGMQAATAADESTRGNVTVGNQASQNAQQASIDRMFKSGQLGLQADAEARQRLELGGVFANNAQSQQLDRLKTGGDLAKATDASVFDQGRGLADIGTAQSTQELNRLQQSTTAGLASDTENRNRVTDYANIANQRDASSLAAEQFNKGVNVDMDAQNYARQQAGQTAANSVQNLFETRQRYGIQDKQQLAQQLSGLVMDSRGKTSAEQEALYEQIIQSYIAESGVDRAAAENYANQMFQSAGIILKAKGK